MTRLPPIVAGDSSMVNANRSSQVYGQTDTMKLLTATKEGYLAFPIPTTLEPGDSITAFVYVPQIGAWSGSRTLTLRAVERWTTAGRNALTWDNRPATVAGSTDHPLTVAGTPDGYGWALLVSLDVAAAVTAGSRKVRFRLRTTDTTPRDVSGIPGAYMVISYTRTAVAPVGLDPGASQVVSVPSPVLSFDATDVRSMQVQLAPVGATFDPTTGFSDPGYDTGEVTGGSAGIPMTLPAPVGADLSAGISPQFDLSASTYPGLAANAVTSWTVRVKDSTGTWSPWAIPEVFSYTPKPVPVINNPTGQVWDRTPPLIATMTGLVQAQWLVYNLSGLTPQVPVYDSKPYATGTPTTLTPNSSVFTDPTATYRTEFRGFDAVAGRVKNAAAGGQVYAVATVDSVPTLDGTVPVVDSTTVTQVGLTPALRVTADVTTHGAPDAFRYFRDGVQISDDLTPVDLLVTGAVYAYTDHTTPPNQPHTHRLVPVVNGHAGQDRDTGQHAVFTTPVDMIWLGDPATGQWVPVGGAGFTLARPEDSTEHVVNRSGLRDANGIRYAAGTLATIRRIRGKQLPMGTVDGTLITSDLGDAADFIAAFLAWQDRSERNPSYVYRLAWKDLNLPVTIGAVELSHTTESDPTLDPIASVTFTYWSA